MFNQYILAIILIGFTLGEAAFPQGLYYIKFKHSGKNLEKVENNRLVQNESRETYSQLWRIVPSTVNGYNNIQEDMGTTITLWNEFNLKTTINDGDDPRQQVEFISAGKGYYFCRFKFVTPNEDEYYLEAAMYYHTPTDGLEEAKKYWLMACKPEERQTVAKTFEAAGVGDFWIEAENCARMSRGAYFDTETSTSGYSGSGYIQSTANTSSSDGHDGVDRATFSINVPISDTYKIWFRIHNNNSIDDDSWFYRLGTGSYTVMDNTTASGWVWVKGSNDLNLSAGSNNIEIVNREDGLKIDKLYLTISNDTPSGLGEATNGCPGN